MQEVMEIIKEFGITIAVVGYFMYKDLTITSALKNSIEKMNTVMTILVDRAGIKTE